MLYIKQPILDQEQIGRGMPTVYVCQVSVLPRIHLYIAEVKILNKMAAVDLVGIFYEIAGHCYLTKMPFLLIKIAHTVF